ncbi:metallophosphoesterase [bacterium]|nr:metallophosphoesterase [bacterium]
MNKKLILICVFLVLQACSYSKIQQPLVSENSVNEINYQLPTFVATGCQGTSLVYKNGVLTPPKEEYKQREVAQTLWQNFQKDKFEALIFLGDNFYEKGLSYKENERNRQIEECYNKNYSKLVEALGKQNVHSIPGNHDYDTQRTDGSFTTSLQKQINWNFHYSLPTSSFFADSLVQFIWVDSEVMLASEDSLNFHCQKITEELEKYKKISKISWRVIATHHPLKSYGKHAGAKFLGSLIKFCEPLVSYFYSDIYQDSYSKIYKNYAEKIKQAIIKSQTKVDFTIAAHEHNLEFIFTKEQNPFLPNYLVISGAAGKSTPVFPTNVEKGYWTASNFGFAKFFVGKTEIEIVFYDGLTGKIISWKNGERVKFLIKK